jgi:hypothetical protein
LREQGSGRQSQGYRDGCGSENGIQHGSDPLLCLSLYLSLGAILKNSGGEQAYSS